MKLANLNQGLWPSTVFRSARPFPTAFEDAFKQFAGLFPTESSSDAIQPPMNASESEDRYLVEVIAPGFALDDIEVTVHGRVLTVTGKRSAERNEGDTVHRRERLEESFERSIEFEVPVDGESVTAELRNGILTIDLPKVEEAKARRIEVRS